MSIASVVLDELARKGMPLLCSPQIVWLCILPRGELADGPLDSKQARDLVAVLTESKQQIDPRLYEMARYSGGGGGGRGYGGRGSRGGGGGGRGGYHSGSNSAPMGNNRRW